MDLLIPINMRDGSEQGESGLEFFRTPRSGQSDVQNQSENIDVIRESVDIRTVMKPVYNFKAAD